MPKPPMVEYFKVTSLVSTQALGETVAALIKLGHTDIHHELVTDVPTFNKRTKHASKAEDFLRGWIADHPTFRANEAIAAFRADGRTNGAGYTALRVLTEQKVLKKLGEGQYARVDVKQLAAPKKARADKRKKGEDVILSYAKRNHGRFSTAKLIEVFVSEGRAKNSVYASIHALVRDKLAKRVGDSGSGQYVLLTKAAKTAPAKSEPKTNSGSQPEVSHG